MPTTFPVRAMVPQYFAKLLMRRWRFSNRSPRRWLAEPHARLLAIGADYSAATSLIIGRVPVALA